MPTPDKNISSYTTKQLFALEREIATEVAKRFQTLEQAKPALKAQMGAELNTKLARVLREMGLPTNAVSASVNIETKPATNGNGNHKPAAKAKRKSKVAVKFRNPNDPTQTWTGRGKQPRWMTASGKSRETFRVSA